jgi:membrane fusion protein (multidrug efflux system)
LRIRTFEHSRAGGVLAAVLAQCITAVACGGTQGTPAAGTSSPPDVVVVSVTPTTLPQSFDLPAQVQPSRRVEVRGRVDGIVLERPFTEGAVVSPGQVLYRLDRVRYEAAFASAQARYDHAKRTLDRIAPLLAQHAVAQQDVDNARTELDASMAALDQARKDLDDTVVRAEIAGEVGRARIEVGGRVTGPADLLTTIDRLDPAYVTFRPSSQQLLAWKADPRSRRLIEAGSALGVRIVMGDGTLFPRTGRLSFVAPSLDSATGTQEFRAQFENHDRALVPGQFVRVRLTGFSQPGALAVPQRAVLQGLGRQFVYVVTAGDTVTARDVQPGPWSGDLWIINGGLKAGDRVVIDGVQKLTPGRRVHPVAAADSATKAATP